MKMPYFESDTTDWVVIDRLVAGIQVPTASIEERRIAADTLRDRGTMLCTIAEMVGVSERTAQRWYPTAHVRQSATCGTRPGYRRHLYRRETPCDDCRAANAAYDRRLGLGASHA